MTAELRDLSDTVIVVTGAGGGIGMAIVQQCLEAGARVVAGELDPERLDSIVAGWGSERVLAVKSDAADPQAAIALVRAGVEAWGRVDSVVANAGIGRFGGLLEHSVEQIAGMVNTNLLGSVWLARAAIEHFRETGSGGDIVITASVAGLGYGGGSEAVYAATKAGQIQFATSLDREVRGEGIRVAVVAPAAVNTTFALATGRFGDTPVEQGPFIPPESVAQAIVMCLRQPRTIRTALWQLHSLYEEV
jgi:3-oxoacyl-[acyl-carrier protein] reductase